MRNLFITALRLCAWEEVVVAAARRLGVPSPYRQKASKIDRN